MNHLETPRTYARTLFINFSSAFNTIQTHLMAEKLIVLNVNPNLIAWILDFLTGRPQYVVLNSAISTMSTINTGVP